MKKIKKIGNLPTKLIVFTLFLLGAFLVNNSFSTESVSNTAKTYKDGNTSYSVIFEYGNKNHVIAGGSDISLSNLLNELGINEKVKNIKTVNSTNNEVLSVEKKGNDYLITSLKSFSSTEYLKVTTKDSKTYNIIVTDPIVNGTVRYQTGSVDHIDIAVEAQARITVILEDGTSTQGNATVRLTQSDLRNSTITAVTKGGTPVTGFTIGSTGTSTGSSGVAQIRLNGSFPVAQGTPSPVTEDGIVIYTVEISRDVEYSYQDENGITRTRVVPTTLIATFNYWDENNDCPGIRNKTTWRNGYIISGSGMDFTMTQQTKALNVIKYVVDEDGQLIHLDKDYDYNMTISGDTTNDGITTYQNGTTFTEDVVLTAGDQSGIGMYYNYSYDYGTYSVTESTPVSTVKDTNGNTYDYVTTYSMTEVLKSSDGSTWTQEGRTGLTSADGYINQYNTYEEIWVFNVYNKHEQTTEVKVNKVWDDNNNEDGKRPSNLSLTLTGTYTNSEGQTVTEVNKTVSITGNGNTWEYTFDNLPLHSFEIIQTENGGIRVQKELINYEVTEASVNDYELDMGSIESKTDENNNIYYEVTLTNTHTPEKININGVKTWNDNDNQDGKRPTSITVDLYANGSKIDSTTATARDNWSYSFTNLDKYAGGQEIEYTIEEQTVANYETTYDGYNITNTHTPEKININGEKTWNDNNNQDGKRPASITVDLYADGSKVDSTTATASDNWSYSFTNLDKYADGEEIEYTIEEQTVANYETTYDGYNITNTHTPEKININGVKAWDDNDNQDGKRPTSITVNLYANGTKIDSTTATASDNWSYSFTNLDKYADGEEIEYTVDEEAIEGYTPRVTGYSIINTHTPEVTSVKVTKSWNDNGNQDRLRPSSIVVVLKNGDTTVATKTITASDNWEYEFTGLDKYANGEEIEYTIEELEIDNYTSKVSGNYKNGFTITNTHTPETIDISGEKIWDDNNNQDGKRPTSVTITLLANGEEAKTATATARDNWKYSFTDLDKYADGEEIEYTIKEENVDSNYTSKVNGYNVTNTHTPEKINITGEKTWVDADDKDGLRPTSVTVDLYANGTKVDSTTATKANNWIYSFTNLDKYAGGEKITYIVKEQSVAHYQTTYDEDNPFIIINTHNPRDIEVSGKKTWNDADNKYGRPTSITVNLSGKVGTDEIVSKSATVTARDNWEYSFTGLPEYKDGKLIEYTITEDAVRDYDTTYDGYDIINTYNPETIDISGVKTWDDNDNQDGKRPTSITVDLYANGEKVDSTTVTEEDNWEFEFTDLVKYANGVEIEYTIEEQDVEGYEKSIIDYNITNTHTPEKVSFNVTKVWNDSDNNDGIRPESITVRLLADGVEVAQTTISSANNWTYNFGDFDKYKNGKEIIYTIVEDEVKGYTTIIEKSITNNKQDVILTNSHENELITITVNKFWDDEDNKYNSRPDSIEVSLYANGKLVRTISVTKDMNWTYTFKNLLKYSDGKEIIYTLEEAEVKGYTASYDGYNITNTYQKPKEEKVKKQNTVPEIIPPFTGLDQSNAITIYQIIIASMVTIFIPVLRRRFN